MGLSSLLPRLTGRGSVNWSLDSTLFNRDSIGIRVWIQKLALPGFISSKDVTFQPLRVTRTPHVFSDRGRLE